MVGLSIELLGIEINSKRTVLSFRANTQFGTFYGGEKSIKKHKTDLSTSYDFIFSSTDMPNYTSPVS